MLTPATADCVCACVCVSSGNLRPLTPTLGLDWTDPDKDCAADAARECTDDTSPDPTLESG